MIKFRGEQHRTIFPALHFHMFDNGVAGCPVTSLTLFCVPLSDSPAFCRDNCHFTCSESRPYPPSCLYVCLTDEVEHQFCIVLGLSAWKKYLSPQ